MTATRAALLLVLSSPLLFACGGNTATLPDGGTTQQPGGNPFTACTAPTFRVPDGGAPAGSPDAGFFLCPDAYYANEGRILTGMRLDGSLGGNSVLPVTSCSASADTFSVTGAGDDFMNPVLKGNIQVSVGCGYVGPGEYTGDGTGLRIDLTPSQYNDRYISNAGSACTFCIEEGAKNGWYNCKDLVPFEGGASRLDVSGTFRCQ